MKVKKHSNYWYTIDYLGNDEVNYQIEIDKCTWSKKEEWQAILQMYTDTWHLLSKNFKLESKQAAFEWAEDQLQSLAIQIAFTQTRAEFKKAIREAE